MAYVGSMGIYTLGKRVGSGGEGEIYEVDGRTVAKIYKSGTDLDDKERKIREMIASGIPEDLKSMVTWPEDILYSGGTFAGFTMRKIESKYLLSSLTEYPAMDLHYQEKGYQTFWILAYNLSYVMARLHAAGIVIGDVNEENIGFADGGLPVVYDCDSFHISQDHPCVVARPEYTPYFLFPALQVGFSRYPGKTFRESSDCWALAVHIFEMLCNGSHPFFCAKDRGSNVAVPMIAENNRNRQTPYFVSMNGLRPPPYAPSMGLMPERIRRMFSDAFTGDEFEIPTARQWMDAIQEVLDDGFGRVCRESNHVLPNEFVRTGGKCPLCEARRACTGKSADREFERYLTKGRGQGQTHAPAPAPSPYIPSTQQSWNPSATVQMPPTPAKKPARRFWQKLRARLSGPCSTLYGMGWKVYTGFNLLSLALTVLTMFTSSWVLEDPVFMQLLFIRAVFTAFSLASLHYDGPIVGAAASVMMLAIDVIYAQELGMGDLVYPVHLGALGVSVCSALAAGSTRAACTA